MKQCPDPRWQHFSETILVFRVPGRPAFEIDLRRVPRPGLAEELAGQGLDGEFAVITAYNPVGPPVDDAFNSQRDRELRARLGGRLGDRLGDRLGESSASGDRSESRSESRSGAGELGWSSDDGVALIRIDGRSPDGHHIEPGYGVALPLEEACELAREFDQAAIFWWDGEAFWLVEAREGGVRVRLPLKA